VLASALPISSITWALIYTKQSDAAKGKKLVDFSMAIANSGHIEQALSHLVDIRASQMNGCAFCLDMHVKEAKLHGERELRLYHVAIWRESPLFTPKERAALAWTEALTQIAPTGISDELYAEVREQFSEKELSTLTFRTPEEAVEKANNTAYGLSAGVWTEKGSRILWMAQRLRAGVVWANTFNRFDPTSPFGGYKESGFGREGGRHGLEPYLEFDE